MINLHAMHQRVILLFSMICLIGACEESAEIAKNYELQASGEFIKLPVDETTPNVSMGLTTYEHYLLNVNMRNNSLQLYDLEQSQLIKKIKFEMEGPDGVGDILGTYFHNLDSIFLFSQVLPQIVLTDTSGKVKQVIKYTQPDEYATAFVHNSYYLSPPLLIDGKLRVKTHLPGNYLNMTEEILSQSAIGLEIDLKTAKVNTLNVKYPAGYLESGLKFFETSIVFEKEQTTYSITGES